MSIYLRIVLFVVSFCVFLYSIYKIRKSQMKIDSVIYWFFFVGLILLLGIFPQIAAWGANLLQVESPVNLVYLVIIFLLIVKVFDLSLKLSQLQYKMSVLVGEIAIRDNLNESDKV